MKTTLTLYAFRPSAFTGRARLFARLVCWWTRSEWAHVGVSLDGWYVEADPLRGVCNRWTVPHGAMHAASWEVDHDPQATAWIKAQMGKPYDWRGVLGFVIGPSKDGRRDRGHWFCSELAAVILRRFGIDVCESISHGARRVRGLEPFPAWEITPGELARSVQ